MLITVDVPYFRFLQDRRLTIAEALSHRYLEEGRLRYHTCMCRCCPNTPEGVHYVRDLDPICTSPMPHDFEYQLNSLSRVQGHYTELAYQIHTTFLNCISIIIWFRAEVRRSCTFHEFAKLCRTKMLIESVVREIRFGLQCQFHC